MRTKLGYIIYFMGYNIANLGLHIAGINKQEFDMAWALKTLESGVQRTLQEKT